MLSKIAKSVQIVLLLVSVVFIGLYFGGGITPETAGTNMEVPVYTSQILSWTYILGVIAIVASVLFSLANMFLNFKAAQKSLVSFAILAVLIVISYSLASDEIMTIPSYSGPDNVPSMLKYAGMNLYAMYILTGLAIVSVLYSEVSKIFK